jgi:hypothetical protein
MALPLALAQYLPQNLGEHQHHYKGRNHHQLHIPNNTHSQNLFSAIHFLDNIQNPKDCNKYKEYYTVEFIGGGFCSQFQSLAGQFMHALAVGNFQRPVLMTGHIRGYSDTKYCDPYNREWTCYFQYPSSCQQHLLQHGRKLPIPSNLKPYAKNPPKVTENLIPNQFKWLGTSFWWGVIQFYLFQPRPFLDNYIHHDSFKSFLSSHLTIFPWNLPVAGIHIRHGDKKDDNWHLHSLQEAKLLLLQSSDCQIQNLQQDCFLYIDFYPQLQKTAMNSEQISSYQHQVYQWVKQSIRGLTTILPLNDVNNYKRGQDNHILRAPLPVLENITKIFESTTSSSNNDASFPLNHPILLQYQRQYVIPLEIFLVSDDLTVLQQASKENHYWIFQPGISQSTGNVGMEKTLHEKSEEVAVNATKEILRDVYYLSQCSTLIGTASSQVFRMAVALANVTGILHDAKAMDKNAVPEIKRLSDQYGVPFPENL